MGHGRARIYTGFGFPQQSRERAEVAAVPCANPFVALRHRTHELPRCSLLPPGKMNQITHIRDVPATCGARPEEEDRGFMILSVWTSSEIVIIRSATDTFSTHNAQLHTRSAAPLPSPPVHSFAQLLTCSLFCRARTRGNDCTRTPAHANCCETEPPRSSRQRLGR